MFTLREHISLAETVGDSVDVLVSSIHADKNDVPSRKAVNQILYRK
jgi:hypothetical protein